MNELDLLEQLIKTGRLPASTPGVTYVGPGTSADNPQKQKEVTISGEPIPNEVIIPKLEKDFHGVDAPIHRPTEAMRQWVNPPLAEKAQVIPRKEDVQSAKDNASAALADWESRIKSPLTMFQADTSPEEAELAKLRAQRAKIGSGSPNDGKNDMDLLTHAIYSLGPGVLGAVTGSTGRGAAAKTYTESMRLKDQQVKAGDERKKADLLKQKDASDRLDKIEKGILDRIGDKETNALNQTKIVMEQARFLVDQTWKRVDLSVKEKNKITDMLLDQVNKFTDANIRSATDIAKMEQNQDQFNQNIEQREKDRLSREKMAKERPEQQQRQRIPWTQDPAKVTNQVPSNYFGAEASHNGRTPISQKEAEMVRGAVGDMGKMRDAVNELVKILPDSPRGMTAEKWAQIQSKARSAQNIYRGKSFADLGVPSHNDQAIMDAVIAAPSTSAGWTGFYNTYNPKSAKNLLRGFVRDQENQVGIKVEPYGIRLKGPGTQSGASSSKETKVINGVTYERAEGGWRRVK